MKTRVLFIALFIVFSGLALPVAAVYAAPPAQSPPDPSWWDDFIPEGYSPSEIGETVFNTVWGLVTEMFATWLRGWFDDLIASFQSWLTHGWDLKNPDSLLGGILDTVFRGAVLLVVPWLSLSITVTFFQRILATIFPGAVRNLSLSQHFGRLLIVVCFINPYALGWLIDVANLTSSMAFSMALGSGGSLAEWEWVSNMMALVNFGVLSFTQIIMAVIALMIMFLTLVILLFIKQLILVFMLGAMPLVACGWLYPFTEGFWGKFWWMYVKLLAAPFILAFGIKIIIAVMSAVGSNILVGLTIMLVLQGVMAWVFFKFLLMPDTLMIAAGGTLAATSGGAAGVPLIIRGATGHLQRATGGRDSGQARVAQQAYRGYQDYQNSQTPPPPPAGGTL